MFLSLFLPVPPTSPLPPKSISMSLGEDLKTQRRKRKAVRIHRDGYSHGAITQLNETLMDAVEGNGYGADGRLQWPPWDS